MKVYREYKLISELKNSFSNKIYRRLYNLRLSSWKFIFLVSAVISIIFHLKVEPNKFINLILVFCDSILTGCMFYVVNTILPERSKIKKIRKVSDNLELWLVNFKESIDKDRVFYGNVAEKRISEVLSTLNTIDREISLERIERLKEKFEVMKDYVRILNNKKPKYTHVEINTYDELMEKYFELLDVVKETEKYYWINPKKI